MNVKVLLVDDHPLTRSGLRAVLSRQPKLKLAGEASTGAAALSMAAKVLPDLIVMDVHLPDMSGIEATRQILRALPLAKVIFLSADQDQNLVDDGLRAGACGYLLKSGAEEELLHAINLVMAGKLYLSPEVSAGIVSEYRRRLSGESQSKKLLLTEREKQLMRLIASGLRNKEIACEMRLSPNSIDTYRARLMKKVGCSSAAELIRYAIRERIAKL